MEASKQWNEELESQFIQHGKELLAQSKPQSLAAEMGTASIKMKYNIHVYAMMTWCNRGGYNVCLNPTVAFYNQLVHITWCISSVHVFSGPIPSISDQDMHGWCISTLDP